MRTQIHHGDTKTTETHRGPMASEVRSAQPGDHRHVPDLTPPCISVRSVSPWWIGDLRLLPPPQTAEGAV